MVTADGAKLNPLISIEWSDDDIGIDVVVDSGADVVVTMTAGLDVVVDSAMVVVAGVAVEVVAATVDVVAGEVDVVSAAVEVVSGIDDVGATCSSAGVAGRVEMVVVSDKVDVVSAAVEETATGTSDVVVSGAVVVTSSVVETTSLVTSSSLRDSSFSSVNPEDSAPCGGCGWHAENATTQAREANATVRNSVFGMPHIRTWRRSRPLRPSEASTVARKRSVSPDLEGRRIHLRANVLFHTRRNTPCRQHSPAQSPN